MVSIEGIIFLKTPFKELGKIDAEERKQIIQKIKHLNIYLFPIGK